MLEVSGQVQELWNYDSWVMVHRIAATATKLPLDLPSLVEDISSPQQLFAVLDEQLSVVQSLIQEAQVLNLPENDLCMKERVAMLEGCNQILRPINFQLFRGAVPVDIGCEGSHSEGRKAVTCTGLDFCSKD